MPSSDRLAARPCMPAHRSCPSAGCEPSVSRARCAESHSNNTPSRVHKHAPFACKRPHEHVKGKCMQAGHSHHTGAQRARRLRREQGREVGEEFQVTCMRTRTGAQAAQAASRLKKLEKWQASDDWIQRPPTPGKPLRSGFTNSRLGGSGALLVSLARGSAGGARATWREALVCR